MDFFADPTKNISQCDIRDGDLIADFGCGSGAYSFALAQKFKTSRIFAIDVQKEIITRITSEIQKQHINNIEPLWADIEKIGGTKIRDHSIDWVFLSNTLFLSETKEILLKEIKRVLRSGGHLCLIDWTGSFSGMGPHSDQVITEEDATKLLKDMGFQIEKNFEAGAHHYGIIARV